MLPSRDDLRCIIARATSGDLNRRALPLSSTSGGLPAEGGTATWSPPPGAMRQEQAAGSQPHGSAALNSLMHCSPRVLLYRERRVVRAPTTNGRALKCHRRALAPLLLNMQHAEKQKMG